MSVKSKFIITRKDTEGDFDDVVLESEGLTIGRLRGNDLVLNHPAVSRTHAGIKEISGDFWLFNLSTSNGTILNGDLVAKTPLADGDRIQIGPYVLSVSYAYEALSITVERRLDPHAVEGQTTFQTIPLEEDSNAGTVVLKRPAAPGRAAVTRSGTLRLSGSGFLTGAFSELDEQALNIFWDKRKREAGKIAARSRLHPIREFTVGKAQWNWRPTLDLRKPWRNSYFVWGSILVLLLSTAAALLYTAAFSPGGLSAAHASPERSTRGIARQPVAGACSSCHTLTDSMQSRCGSCHQTQSFRASIYEAHQGEGMTCTACHDEHQGHSSRSGLLTYGICYSCHNDVYTIKHGQRAGKILVIPHGGRVGYPLVNGQWKWPGLPGDVWLQKGLPAGWAVYTPRDQFHLLHMKGRMEGRSDCRDCHSEGVRTETGYDPRWNQSPRAECGKCHGLVHTPTGPQRVRANCNTCHQQHGQSEDFARLAPLAGKDPARVKEYLASLDTSGPDREMDPSAPTLSLAAVGGADVIGQDRAYLSLSFVSEMGALPWYAWLGVLGLLPVAGLILLLIDTARRKEFLRRTAANFKVVQGVDETRVQGTRSIDLQKLKAEGPPYPHPVVDPLLCIGCHACVEACPHDVLTIVNGIATPVAVDQCMEDTSCQVECPTNPKACVVINTTKVIPTRKVPSRNNRLMTNVDGIYLIGDVSGVPLIKNAVNEGAQVIEYVAEDIRRQGSVSRAEYDVVIIGIGPAGLSAAVTAKQTGLKYVALEQDKLVSTIQNYPAGKYVFFKPDTMEASGILSLAGAGEVKEAMLQAWMNTVVQNGIEIREEESCKDIKREDGVFAVVTEKDKTKDKATYRAHRIILAIGNRGAPMRLKVPGEDLSVWVQPVAKLPDNCPQCGIGISVEYRYCPSCGKKIEAVSGKPFLDSKVKYKLTDPDEYAGKRCMVVGAGNSAVEAAVDLCGFRRDGAEILFTRSKQVTLVVRSDFKGDLKLLNKMNAYDCIDSGRIKVYFRTEIKEIQEDKVLLMDVRSKQEVARIPNDCVFALIGGDKPTKFLEGLGIKIG